MLEVEAVAEAVVDVAKVVVVNVDPPGKQEKDVHCGCDRQRTPTSVSGCQEAEEDREDEERALVFRQQRSGEAESRQREGPTFVRDHPAPCGPGTDAEDEREREVRVTGEQLAEHGGRQRYS